VSSITTTIPVDNMVNRVYSWLPWSPNLMLALLSRPPHNFVSPPCFSYRLYEVRSYEPSVTSMAHSLLSSFMNIRPAVLKFRVADVETDMSRHVSCAILLSRTLCEGRISSSELSNLPNLSTRNII
jgi:hypothetical protein